MVESIHSFAASYCTTVSWNGMLDRVAYGVVLQSAEWQPVQRPVAGLYQSISD